MSLEEALLLVLKSGATVEWQQLEFKLSPDLLRKEINTYENEAYAGFWTLNMDGARMCVFELEHKNNQCKNE